MELVSYSSIHWIAVIFLNFICWIVGRMIIGAESRELMGTHNITQAAKQLIFLLPTTKIEKFTLRSIIYSSTITAAFFVQFLLLLIYLLSKNDLFIRLVGYITLSITGLLLIHMAVFIPAVFYTYYIRWKNERRGKL